MQFAPRPNDPAPRRIRRIGRLVAILALAVMFIAMLWVFTGIPTPVATAMDDALWAPCPAQYQAARTAIDSGLADGYVLRPRTRFERAITCGSEQRRRAASASVLSPDESSLAPGTIAFGVFGDGPYYPWESARYRRLLRAVDASHPAWLLHVGDLFWRPCSDAMMSERRREFDAMTTPVVYVPGDNEWTDCHSEQTGAFDPLERLAQLRRTLLPVAAQSLGRTPLRLTSQADQAAWREFAEHRRWTRGRVVFATLHLVGSDNGRASYPARTPAHDAEVARRTVAAVAWLGETFDSASAQGAGAVVLAWHGNPGFDTPSGARRGYESVLDTLRARALRFAGDVLVIHGDSHQQHVDRPLRDAGGALVENVTRLETFGSPEIGWVRVVVDTVRGKLVAMEPRLVAKRALVF